MFETVREWAAVEEEAETAAGAADDRISLSPNVLATHGAPSAMQ